MILKMTLQLVHTAYIQALLYNTLQCFPVQSAADHNKNIRLITGFFRVSVSETAVRGSHIHIEQISPVIFYISFPSQDPTVGAGSQFFNESIRRF